MKRSVLTVLSIAAAASLWASSSRAEEPPKPAEPTAAPAVAVASPLISVERDLIDLGDLTRGAKAEASFVLRNSGARPVKILSARPG